MVEPQSSKLATRVRFPSSAPFFSSRVIVDILVIPSFQRYVSRTMVRPAGRGLLTPKSLAETVNLGGCCCGNLPVAQGLLRR